MKLDDRIGRRVRIARNLPRYPLGDLGWIGRTGITLSWETGPDGHTTHWLVGPDGTETSIAAEAMVWGQSLVDCEASESARALVASRRRPKRVRSDLECFDEPEDTHSIARHSEPETSWLPGNSSLLDSLVRDGAERFELPSKETCLVPRVRTTFTPWPHPITINTFGNKPVLDASGEQTFAEVAFIRRFQAAGWQARWLETYCAPASWPLELDRWHPAGIKSRQIAPIDDPRVVAGLRKIIEHNDGRCAGCWDTVAWRRDEIVFGELKHKGKDRMRDTQRRWLDAALRAGFTVTHFLVVEWSETIAS
ncbi:MAG: hypothetical protein K8S98_10980 [Planctomycetes bacterium]|nr:hypothetical protein [Planctomycetota bacterium]